MSAPDPVRIVAAWIDADNAKFDAEQDATVELSTVDIERALAEAIAARQVETHP